MAATMFPLRATNERTLDPGYVGPVYVWDIDKTYLATGFSSLKGLAKIPLEFAVDKRAISGMPEVLRGLRRGPGPSFASAPLYFVSSSPPQLRPVIEHKMLLDGVQPDGFTFKDWAGTLRQLRPKRLKEHLGYKLTALLYGRTARPSATEYLFGDDVEADADTYSLYARLLAGELDASAVEEIMTEAGVAAEDRRGIHDLWQSLPTPMEGKVGRIFIHLARKSKPDRFERHGPRLLPVQGAFQLSLALYQLGLIDADAVSSTRNVAVADGALTPHEERARLTDALERGLIAEDRLEGLGLVV